MVERQASLGRTFAGLASAICVAPVATALCIEAIILSADGFRVDRLSDEVGGFVTFLVLALVFGSVISIVPGLIFGGLAIAIARLAGTRAPLFYAVAGLVAGLVMALVDTGRTKSAFAMLAAAPFMFGGCLGGLTYWAVAERWLPFGANGD